MRPPPLWQISVVTTPADEPAITRRLTEVFGPVVASYDDVETGVCTVMAFVEAAEAEIRNPKSEIRKKSEARNPKPDGGGSLRISDFSLPSDFGFRISDFQSALRAALAADAPSAHISCQKLRREDWAESWKRHFKPLEIGARLLVKPSWSRRAPRRGQAVVVLDPGLSFGTGQHPTTSFCLRQVATFRRPGTAQSCLDIGTGSGILAIAAAKLGYAPVQAFDFDPEAVRVARQNVRSNGVAPAIRLSQQDVTQPPGRAAKKFDLVCANLLADLLVSALPQITARVAPCGRLVIAGILQREFDTVRRAYEAYGWRLVASRVKNEWQSGAFEADAQISS